MPKLKLLENITNEEIKKHLNRPKFKNDYNFIDEVNKFKDLERFQTKGTYFGLYRNDGVLLMECPTFSHEGYSNKIRSSANYHINHVLSGDEELYKDKVSLSLESVSFELVDADMWDFGKNSHHGLRKSLINLIYPNSRVLYLYEPEIQEKFEEKFVPIEFKEKVEGFFNILGSKNVGRYISAVIRSVSI